MKPLGRHTKENFKRHDQDNPEIWALFEYYALGVAQKRPYYSAKAIFHRVRWHTEIEENNSDFKISDGWISHYARKFLAKYPEHEGFFRTTKRKITYHED